MVVVLLGVELCGLVDVRNGLRKREPGDVHLHLAVVDLAERQKVLHDAGHAVGFVDDNAHEIIVKLAGEIISCGDDRLGVGFDVGKRCPQLVRYVRDKFAPRLLAFSLLGHVVNDDQRAALRLIGRKRRHEKLQLAVARRLLRLQVLRALQG